MYSSPAIPIVYMSILLILLSGYNNIKIMPMQPMAIVVQSMYFFKISSRACCVSYIWIIGLFCNWDCELPLVRKCTKKVYSFWTLSGYFTPLYYFGRGWQACYTRINSLIAIVMCCYKGYLWVKGGEYEMNLKVLVDLYIICFIFVSCLNCRSNV